MVIDIHSHVSLLGLFIVGNSYDDVYRFERHVVFPKIMVGGSTLFRFVVEVIVPRVFIKHDKSLHLT